MTLAHCRIQRFNNQSCEVDNAKFRKQQSRLSLFMKGEAKLKCYNYVCGSLIWLNPTMGSVSEFCNHDELMLLV
ncbi:CLUMA_CG017465, isoform A [Clunio marinus]|uniref:CLUMA_CG017465, isoform A n=1 Tax=Clunio marinus TaxID=568069 RepID=A0A1J1IVY9_9DIPT|nr:CLUMA_CG017465, isoform A [Clunio marinus]